MQMGMEVQSACMSDATCDATYTCCTRILLVILENAWQWGIQAVRQAPGRECAPCNRLNNETGVPPHTCAQRLRLLSVAEAEAEVDVAVVAKG